MEELKRRQSDIIIHIFALGDFLYPQILGEYDLIR